MRYAYSVIRFVPDPVRGEFVNIGVIAGSDESSEWDLRTLVNQKRARLLDDKELLPAALAVIDEIGRMADRYDEAVQSSLLTSESERLSENWLGQLSIDSRNVIQFSPPSIIVESDLDAALDVLFQQFVLEPDQRRPAFRNKHAALAAVRQAFRNVGLRKIMNYEESLNVQGEHHSERFDFVVMNGAAVQLTQTWSFQVPNQGLIREQVKAWSWTVQDLRRHGGVAFDSDRELKVPKDIAIEVVYVPPIGTQSKSSLDEALAAFADVKARAVELDDAPRIARDASRLIRQHSRP